MTDPSKANGGCLCGAVRFEIELPTKWCANCHCSICRRAHGAAFVTWFGVPSAQFRFLGGEDHLTRFQSSSNAKRAFCATCGSPMLFESSRWPGEVHVARACVPGPIDRDPGAHVFFDDRAEWLTVDDHLKKLGGKTGVEPLDGR